MRGRVAKKSDGHRLNSARGQVEEAQRRRVSPSLYYKNLFLTASIFIRGATISLNACVVPIIYARPKGCAVEGVGNIKKKKKERKKEKVSR